MADDAINWTLDYLGRQQPIGQRSISALPSQAGGGAVTAPVTPFTAPGGAAPGGDSSAAPDQTSASGGPGRVSIQGPSPLMRALSGLLGTTKALEFARLLFGKTDLASSIGGAGGLGAVGEDTLASLGGETIPQAEIDALLAEFPGGAQVATDFAGLGVGDVASGIDAGVNAGLAGQAVGAGTEAAAEAGTELAGSAPTSMAGPIFAALTAAVDLLGEGKIPFQNVIEALFPGTFGHSKDWLTFGPRLSQTLQGEDAATTALARALMGASGADAVQKAIADWKAAVGQYVPGFGAGTDPLDMPGLPGATGSRHERRINADFGPIQAGLQALEQAALQGLPQDQRLAAFTGAVQPILEAIQAEQRRRQQESEDFNSQASEQLRFGE